MNGIEIRDLDPNDTAEATRWYAAMHAGATVDRSAPIAGTGSGSWPRWPTCAGSRSTIRTRRLHTWTAVTNDATRSINDGFGFGVVESMHEVELAL